MITAFDYNIIFIISITLIIDIDYAAMPLPLITPLLFHYYIIIFAYCHFRRLRFHDSFHFICRHAEIIIEDIYADAAFIALLLNIADYTLIAYATLLTRYARYFITLSTLLRHAVGCRFLSLHYDDIDDYFRRRYAIAMPGRCFACRHYFRLLLSLFFIISLGYWLAAYANILPPLYAIIIAPAAYWFFCRAICWLFMHAAMPYAYYADAVTLC